jgi:hypothetical protein
MNRGGNFSTIYKRDHFVECVGRGGVFRFAVLRRLVEIKICVHLFARLKIFWQAPG